MDGLDPITPYIKKYEGYTSKPSWDYKQWSVGYGTRASGPNDVVDPVEAERRLSGEISKARSAVSAFAPNAPQGVQDALTSLTYNAGPGWQNGGLGKAVQSGDYDTARNLFLQYNKAGGQVNEGLVGRRYNEVSSLWDGKGASGDGSLPNLGTPAQTAITKAMAGNNDDNTQLPVGARPVMFQGGGQPQGNGLFSMLQGNDVPDTGIGRMFGMGNVGSAIGAIGRGLVTAVNPTAGAQLQANNANAQLAMSGDLKQVGTDMFGHPIMAWVDKMRHTITPATMNGSAGGAGGSSSGSMGSTGTAGGTGLGGMGSNINEDTLRQFQAMPGTAEEKLAKLQQMSPAAYSVVQGLRNGSESINLLPRQGEGRAGWIALAQSIDPNFKGESDYAQRVAQAKDETTQGKFGQTLKSADQLMGHLNSLSGAVDNLHNGAIPIWNRIANAFGENTGNDATQKALGDFGSFKEAAATELVKMMRANGGAESDVNAWREKLDAAKSPTELKAAINSAIDIMHTTVGSNVEAHNRIFHDNKTAESFLSPKAQAIVKQLGANAKPKQQSSAQVQDGATATGPNGHQIVMKGGQWLDAQTGQPLN